MIISDEYKNIMRKMHNSGMGTKSRRSIDQIDIYGLPQFIEKWQPKTSIDYGCGQGKTVEKLRVEYGIEAEGFDPGVKAFSVLPDKKFDMFCSWDVMEHIEPEHLDSVIETISKLSDNYYFSIHLTKAKKKLPDGRNAHLIIETPEWWKEKLSVLGNVIHEDILLNGKAYEIVLEKV